MKINSSFTFGLIIVLLNFSNSRCLAANSHGPTSSIFDEMSYAETMDITLEFDMDALTSNIRNTDKHKAILSFIDQNGNDQRWNTKVNLRGKFRRMNCREMPPLKIHFKKDDLKAAGLLTFDDLKLVTHCIEDKALAKELLLKEFLVYKLYNQITDESFRVQFLNITYLDTKTGMKKKQSAFLIEDTAQLRARLNALKCSKPYGIAADQFEANQVNTMALYQYMIGNADWGLHVAKNVKMIRRGDKILAIPYDFDFSGFVNAPYAIANSNVGQTSLTERIYLGTLADQKSLKPDIERLFEKKRIILKYIKNFKLLKFDTRKEVIKYVKSFFKTSHEIQFNKKDIGVTVAPTR